MDIRVVIAVALWTGGLAAALWGVQPQMQKAHEAMALRAQAEEALTQEQLAFENMARLAQERERRANVLQDAARAIPLGSFKAEIVAEQEGTISAIEEPKDKQGTAVLRTGEEEKSFRIPQNWRVLVKVNDAVRAGQVLAVGAERSDIPALLTTVNAIREASGVGIDSIAIASRGSVRGGAAGSRKGFYEIATRTISLPAVATQFGLRTFLRNVSSSLRLFEPVSFSFRPSEQDPGAAVSTNVELQTFILTTP